MITYELNFTGVSRLLYVIPTINLYSGGLLSAA